MIQATFLAQVIGAFCVVMGISMALRRKMMMEIFRELVASRALFYVVGVAMLAIGLLLGLRSTQWDIPAQAVLTIVGWLIVLESLAYLFATSKFLKQYMTRLRDKKIYYGIALAYVLLGAYLL